MTPLLDLLYESHPLMLSYLQVSSLAACQRFSTERGCATLAYGRGRRQPLFSLRPLQSYSSRTRFER